MTDSQADIGAVQCLVDGSSSHFQTNRLGSEDHAVHPCNASNPERITLKNVGQSASRKQSRYPTRVATKSSRKRAAVQRLLPLATAGRLIK